MKRILKKRAHVKKALDDMEQDISRMLGLNSGMGIFTPKAGRTSIAAVASPYEVFKILKQAYCGVKADVEFPNRLRPLVNPGTLSEYSPASDFRT